MRAEIMNDRLLALILPAFLLAATVATPQQAIEEGEAILNEDVLESGVLREPDEQGMRPPEPVDESDAVDLYALLAQLRRAPPGLDGQPVARPNLWASEPETEMVPQQPRDAYLFPPEYVE
jgi:hypothetical protein